MKQRIEPVHADDDRDIGKVPRQLELPFDTLPLVDRGGGDIRRVHPEHSTMYSPETLAAAWQKFSRGKRNRADVKTYRSSLSRRLDMLALQLREQTYRHGNYTAFTVQDPKTRRIHKAAVRDRIVHQLLVDMLEPVFEPRFIYDSFSCRRGKGTHAGVARLRRLLRRASHNDSRTVYVLKCDIRQFFCLC